MSWRFVRRRNFFSLSRQRSLLRKETASRSSARLIPLRPRSGEPAADHCPPPTLSGRLIIESLLTLGSVWGEFSQKPSQGRARPFKRFCPPLTHSPHSALSHLPSRFGVQQTAIFNLFQCGSRETHQAFSPTTCSFFARMIGDTFGSLSQPTGPRTGPHLSPVHWSPWTPSS